MKEATLAFCVMIRFFLELGNKCVVAVMMSGDIFLSWQANLQKGEVLISKSKSRDIRKFTIVM